MIYLQNIGKLSMRGNQDGCTDMLDILSYVMNKINKHNKVLLIGYRELIHAHCERDFLNKTTLNYINNDIDT